MFTWLSLISWILLTSLDLINNWFCSWPQGAAEHLVLARHLLHLWYHRRAYLCLPAPPVPSQFYFKNRYCQKPLVQTAQVPTQSHVQTPWWLVDFNSRRTRPSRSRRANWQTAPDTSATSMKMHRTESWLQIADPSPCGNANEIEASSCPQLPSAETKAPLQTSLTNDDKWWQRWKHVSSNTERH